MITEAAALKTSEAGRSVALHPDLVQQARRLYETSLPALAPSADIISRLEGVRRIEQQLVGALGTQFQPTPDLAVTAQTAALWGEQELRKVVEAQTLASALVQESRIKVTNTPLTPASPTLEAAIAQLRQAELATRERTILTKTSEAKTKAADTVAKAEAQRILQEARLHASNLVAQAAEAAGRLPAAALQGTAPNEPDRPRPPSRARRAGRGAHLREEKDQWETTT